MCTCDGEGKGAGVWRESLDYSMLCPVFGRKDKWTQQILGIVFVFLPLDPLFFFFFFSSLFESCEWQLVISRCLSVLCGVGVTQTKAMHLARGEL